MYNFWIRPVRHTTYNDLYGSRPRTSLQ